MENDGGGFRGIHRDLFEEVTAEQALAFLREGNKRYINGVSDTADDASVRRELAERGQRPFACVIGCSDSRVAPERIFDVGAGQLFVIRGAGNTADDTVIGSAEYAAGHLHVPLIVVMGHTGCGMIAAALACGEESPHLNAVIARIKPSIDKVRLEYPDGVTAGRCEDENICNTVAKLGESRILRGLLERGKLKIIGAKYELESGIVDFRIDKA